MNSSFGRFILDGTPCNTTSLIILSMGAHLYLTNDIGQPFAAGVLALYRFVCNSVCDDEEDFGEVGVVWSKHNGIVAAEGGKTVSGVRFTKDFLLWKVKRRRGYLSMRSHRKSNVWTASSLSSLSGSQLSQWGRILLTSTHSGRNLMTFPTAEMQFSVAFMFSLERESPAWMTPTSTGMASGGGRQKVNETLHFAAREPQWRVAPRPTCAVLAVAFASKLSHDANTVSGRLPNLGSQVS